MGRGFFQAGWIGLDLDDLNGNLVEAGHPSLDDSFLTLGGSGYGTHGRFMIGGEGQAVVGSKETSPNGARQVSANGGYGLFRMGVLVVSRGGLDVFPLLGVGGGAMSLQIAGRSSPTFGQVLDDPDRGSTLSTAMFLLDVALGVNYRILVSESDDGAVGGLLLGVQAGYAFAPGDTSWELDGINDVAGGPDLRIQGFHVRFSLGGWGMSPAEERRRRTRGG